jgi:flagellar hook-associated protein 3 FlgL
MVQIRYGDLAQTLLLANTTSTAKSAITRLQQEVTTGLSSDTVRHLSGNLGQINAVDTSLTRLSGFKTATNELGSLATASQTALGTITEFGEGARSALLISIGTASVAQVDNSALAARTAMEGVISTLNSNFGERSMFAGTRLSGPAVADFATMMTALETAVASATSAADAAALVTDWFDDPAGYTGTAYLGGPANDAVPIAEGETAAVSLTANDTAIRDYLKGLAMGALLDRGLFVGQPETRRDLAGLAGKAMLSAQSGMTYLAADLGGTETRIANAATRNGAESTALGLARVDLVGVDSYEASTQLTTAEEKLQLLYALTARLSNLSLVEYLR